MRSYTDKEESSNLPALYKLLKKKCFEVIVIECCNPVERRSVYLTRMGGKAIVSDFSNFASLHNSINNNFNLHLKKDSLVSSS